LGGKAKLRAARANTKGFGFKGKAKNFGLNAKANAAMPDITGLLMFACHRISFLGMSTITMWSEHCQNEPY